MSKHSRKTKSGSASVRSMLTTARCRCHAFLVCVSVCVKMESLESKFLKRFGRKKKRHGRMMTLCSLQPSIFAAPTPHTTPQAQALYIISYINQCTHTHIHRNRRGWCWWPSCCCALHPNCIGSCVWCVVCNPAAPQKISLSLLAAAASEQRSSQPASHSVSQRGLK
jgi:hypothetical protein